MTQTTDLTPTAADRARTALVQLRSALAPLLALVVVTLFFTAVDWFWFEGTFATARNAGTVAVQTCVVAVAALGMTVIIVSGGIDLSAGAALALCATMLAWGLREDLACTLTYGGNFASLTRRLEHDQQQLLDLQADSEANERELAAWERSVLRRARLLSLAERKLPLLESLRDAAGDDDLPKREEGVVRLRGCINHLRDTSTQFTKNADWPERIANSPYSAPLAVALALLTGVCTGLANGALISTLKVVPFIVTLGTMTIFVGLGNILSGSVPIRPSLELVPDWLPALVRNSPRDLWFGAPIGVWLALLLAGALALVLRYTVFGRHVFALGSNEATARLCGINVPATKIALYALAGLFIGVAGVYFFSRTTTGSPTEGAGMELRAIAAVVIGGASLNGGRGTIIGTLAGAAIMAVIDSGCTQIGLENPVQDIILGVIIISAVVVDQLRQRRG